MKRNRLAVLAGTGLMAALAASPAKAIPATNCSPSSLQVCAAVQYSVGQATSGQWQVTVWAWNLFGDPSLYPGSLSSVITYVGLASSAWSGTFTVASATFGTTDVSGAWIAASGLNSNLGAKLDVAATETGVQNGLIGCYASQQFITQLNTCYSDQTKALKVVFNTFDKQGNNSQFVFGSTASMNYWEVHGQEVNNQQNCSLWWNSNGNSTLDANTNCTTSTIPEPVTMALLGTGLAGMGLAGLRRRFKKNGDIESA